MNSDEEKEYSESELLSLVQKAVDNFEKETNAAVEVDLSVVDECYRRLEKTLYDGFTPVTEPNAYKVAGTFCFWLRKLKPFKVQTPPPPHPYARYVNETVAFIAAFQIISGYLSTKGAPIPKITPKYFNDLVVSLRYHSYSPHALVQLFEGLNI